MGVNDEVFRLKLDGDEVPIASDYTVKAGVLTVPAAFDMTVGHAGMTADLVSRYPEFTPFELFVGDVKVQNGEVDSVKTIGGRGTQLQISGRDMLKWLIDTKIPSDRTVAEKTFLQLTELALEASGLGGAPIATDNTANRKAITGSDTIKELTPVTEESAETEAGGTETLRTVHRTIKAKLGTSWWDFLTQQNRRAGLFLWYDVSTGGFVLSRPNGQQAPLYRIVRRRNRRNEPGDVNVLGQPSFARDSTKRFTEIQVSGRSGSGKAGRGGIKARVFDEEMIALLNRDPADRADGGKRKKIEIVYDDKVRTQQMADFLARRVLAESRRNGWSLTYTVAGHVAPALTGGGYAVWQPDTVVEVIDDELGLEGPMYIESLTYRRTPQTTTEIRIMRIEDLLFAEEDFDSPPKLAPRKGVNRVGTTEKLLWIRDPQWGNLPLLHSQNEQGKISRGGFEDFPSANPGFQF